MWNRSENQIKLVMIRHGATPSNKEHRYLGRTDEGLSIEGDIPVHASASISDKPMNAIANKIRYFFIFF